MQYAVTESPVGPLLLVMDDTGLRLIHFQAGPRPLTPEAEWRSVAALPGDAAAQLAEYFAGERRAFDLPLAPAGTTFQLEVWAAVEEIPYGETVTYAGLARRLGNAASTRAVGLANGRNPLPVVIPCHRVVGSDGSLTGYGGGLAIKRTLLAHEQHHGGTTPEQLSLW